MPAKVCCLCADEPLHRQSHVSNVWGTIVWMVSGYQPTTYSCQKSLPRLPVPPLNATIDQFLESIKPLYGGEDSLEYRRFKEKSEACLNFDSFCEDSFWRIFVVWFLFNKEKYSYCLEITYIDIQNTYVCFFMLALVRRFTIN